MKKTFITTAVIVGITVLALIMFNKLISKKNKSAIFAEAEKGTFEITISTAGELIPEKSLDIFGPTLGVNPEQQQQQNRSQGGGGGGNRPGGGGGGGGFQGGRAGGGGFDFHLVDFRIQDMVPEGTIVKKGDYIAQLDRTSYDNTLKDALESLKTLQNNVDMKVLDTAMTLTSLRDEIKNQRYAVEEAAIALDESKFEPPATQRKAKMNLDKAQRSLEQKTKIYDLRIAQSLADIRREKMLLSSGTKLAADLQEFLTKFTIRAPTDGMVTYKKDRLGIKKKVGSSINPFDNVICTLPDLSSMISKLFVSEIEVSRVKSGQKVKITIDALPGKAFTGSVMSVANIGETLPNSDAKMFEVQIKLDESDPALRPAMTTSNEIIIKTFDDVIWIPAECVQTGADSIPFVYEKNKTRQIVVLGEANEKNIIVEKGLEPGVSVYTVPPAEAETFRMKGKDLIPVIKEREKARRAESNKLITDL